MPIPIRTWTAVRAARSINTSLVGILDPTDSNPFFTISQPGNSDMGLGINFSPLLDPVTGLVTGTSILGNFVKLPMVAADTGGGVVSWKNPLAVPLIITRVLVLFSTMATGALTLDIGTTTVSAATLSDNMIDGIDGNTGPAPVMFDSMLAATQGTNGLPSQYLPVGNWFTASKASGATAGIIGTIYLSYMPVQ